MSECIFCEIVSRKIPTEVIYEDGSVLAFNDINPKYPVHIIIIPKVHLTSTLEAEAKHDTLLGRLLRIGAQLAREKGIARSGFRLLTNTGKDSGQVVPHLHVHLLGGEKLRSI